MSSNATKFRLTILVLAQSPNISSSKKFEFDSPDWGKGAGGGCLIVNQTSSFHWLTLHHRLKGNEPDRTIADEIFEILGYQQEKASSKKTRIDRGIATI